MTPNCGGQRGGAFSTPEVAIPLIPLLLIALYIGRKTKGRINAAKIKGMEAQVDAANQRLQSVKEQRAAGADVERELETMRKQVVDLQRRLEAGAQHTELMTSVHGVTEALTKLCSANDELQRRFVQIGSKSQLATPHDANGNTM